MGISLVEGLITQAAREKHGIVIRNGAVSDRTQTGANHPSLSYFNEIVEHPVFLDLVQDPTPLGVVSELEIRLEDSGDSLNSPYVELKKQNPTSSNKTVVLTTGFLRHLDSWLKDCYDGQGINQSTILCILLHEAVGHKFRNDNHTEEYVADAEAIYAMGVMCNEYLEGKSTLYVDPWEYERILTAFTSYERKTGEPLMSTHPHATSRLDKARSALKNTEVEFPNIQKRLNQASGEGKQTAEKVAQMLQISPAIEQQRSLFVSDATDLYTQTLRAENYVDFWHKLTLLDTRKVSEVAIQEAVDVSCNALLLSKLLVIVKALNAFPTLQAARQNRTEDFGEDINLRINERHVDETRRLEKVMWFAMKDGKKLADYSNYLGLNPDGQQQWKVEEEPTEIDGILITGLFNNILSSLTDRYLRRESEAQNKPMHEIVPDPKLFSTLMMWEFDPGHRSAYQIFSGEQLKPKQTISKAKRQDLLDWLSYESTKGDFSAEYSYREASLATIINLARELSVSNDPHEKAFYQNVIEALGAVGSEVTQQQRSLEFLPHQIYRHAFIDNDVEYTGIMNAAIAERKKIKGVAHKPLACIPRDFNSPEMLHNTHLAIAIAIRTSASAAMTVLAAEDIEDKLMELNGEGLQNWTDEEISVVRMALQGDISGIRNFIDKSDYKYLIELYVRSKLVLLPQGTSRRTEASINDKYTPADGYEIANLLKKPGFPQAQNSINMVDFEYNLLGNLRDEVIYAVFKRLLPPECLEQQSGIEYDLREKYDSIYKYFDDVISRNITHLEEKQGYVTNIEELYSLSVHIGIGSWLLTSGTIDELFYKDGSYLNKLLSTGDYTDTNTARSIRGGWSIMRNNPPDLETLKKLLDTKVFDIFEIMQFVTAGLTLKRFDASDSLIIEMITSQLKLSVAKTLSAKVESESKKHYSEFVSLASTHKTYVYFGNEHNHSELEIAQGKCKYRHSSFSPYDYRAGSFMRFTNLLAEKSLPLPAEVLVANLELLAFEKRTIIEDQLNRLRSRGLLAEDGKIGVTKWRPINTELINLALDVIAFDEGVVSDELVMLLDNLDKIKGRNFTGGANTMRLKLLTRALVIKDNHGLNELEVTRSPFNNFRTAVHEQRVARKVCAQIAQKFNFFENSEHVADGLNLVSQAFPTAGAYRGELLAYLWSIAEFYKPEIANAILPELISATEFSQETNYLFARAQISSADSQSYSGSFGRKGSKVNPRRIARIKGKHFFADEIDKKPHTRRFHFNSAYRFPFTKGTMVDIDNCSFVEYAVSKQLLLFDEQIQVYMKSGSILSPLELINTITNGQMHSPVEMYMEFIIRKILGNEDINMDLETLTKIETDYLRRFSKKTLAESGLMEQILERTIRVKTATDKNPLLDYNSGFELITKYLTTASSRRNNFLDRLQLECSPTPKQLNLLQTFYLEETGNSVKDGESKSQFLTDIENLSQLSEEQKGKLLLYILGDDNSVPDGEMIIDYLDVKRTDATIFRHGFQAATNWERTEVIYRLLVGPRGRLDDNTDPTIRRQFCNDLANVVIPDNSQKSSKNLSHYRKVLAAGFNSVPIHMASEMLSAIANKRVELAQSGLVLNDDDLAFIALQSIVTGPKIGQLISDTPGLGKEVQKAFRSSMWNNMVIKPSEILRVWDAEKRAGFFPDVEIVQFVRSLGSAGVSQAYEVLVKVRNADNDYTEERIAMKCVKPQIVASGVVAREIDSIPGFLAELKLYGYKPDIPRAFPQLVQSVIIQERNKLMEADFQERYTNYRQSKGSKHFGVMEVYGSSRFIIFEELNRNDVQAKVGVSKDVSLAILQGVLEDIKDDNCPGLHLDLHLGNIFTDMRIIDFGFIVDFSQRPELREAYRNLVGGLATGSQKRLISALTSMGIDDTSGLKITPGLFTSKNLESFRQLVNNQTDDTKLIDLYKAMWLMYRLQAHYDVIKAHPILLAKVAAKLSKLVI